MCEFSSKAFAEWDESLPGKVTTSDKVGIGTSSPSSPLTVHKKYKTQISTATTKNIMELKSSPAVLQLGQNGPAGLSPPATVFSVDIRGSIYAKYKTGIGTDKPEAMLEVKGSLDPLFVVNHSGKSRNPAIWFKQDDEEMAYIWTNHDKTLNFGNPDINPILSLSKNGNVGIGTVSPAAKLVVAGRTRTKELEITGGGDLAEPFDIIGSESIKPGMVVAIDPKHPGQLRIADKSYDRTVAGCVSGANGIKSGLTMRQEGTKVDGSLLVALSGRVYCWADASYGSIQPGDLLTTSETPGHVMTVTDYSRAQGAIIGKAMCSLDKGTGLILILVSLQ